MASAISTINFTPPPYNNGYNSMPNYDKKYTLFVQQCGAAEGWILFVGWHDIDNNNNFAISSLSE